MDNMEWELKVRNQAMKRGCASVQMDGLKQALYMVRTVVDTFVKSLYIMMQIAVCLLRLLLPSPGDSVVGQVIAEMNFWFNELIIITVESVKRLADLLFNLIFSSGRLGETLKTIVQWICKLMQVLLWVWNNTGGWCVVKAMPISYTHSHTKINT
jgi:hypothetical protein